MAYTADSLEHLPCAHATFDRTYGLNWDGKYDDDGAMDQATLKTPIRQSKQPSAILDAGKTPGSSTIRARQDIVVSSSNNAGIDDAPSLISQATHNHNEHWTNTVQSLNLRGILLAGMAVFIAYFSIRGMKTPLPRYFVMNPYMSALCFSVVVSRIHLLGTLEDQMSAWWDRTIDNASRACRFFDYALEGPWTFLLLALPFSCISPVTFGAAYFSWSALETCYMLIGQKALHAAPEYSLGGDTKNLVTDYYRIRRQNEALASLLALAAGAMVVVHAYNSHISFAIAAWCLIAALLLHVNFVEVFRNPWFILDLSHRDDADEDGQASNKDKSPHLKQIR